MRFHRFSAMGCEVVVGGAAAGAVTRIEALFHERDQRFSRFRADSELSRVNAVRSRLVHISPDFEAMLRRALRAALNTGGLVDPTLGGAIEAAGYDCDFDELSSCNQPHGRGEPGRWRSLRLSDRWLSRPPGLRLDLNGVVKWHTVDDALELMAGEGFVSAGGDLASRGPVDIGLPGYGSVRLVEGGLATSGSARRHWLRAGVQQHHLIDPQTGRPSDSPWLEVTVSAATCLQADVAAKAAFLLGLGGPAWLDSRGLPGRFVFREGKTLANLTWKRSMSLGEAAA